MTVDGPLARRSCWNSWKLRVQEAKRFPGQQQQSNPENKQNPSQLKFDIDLEVSMCPQQKEDEQN